MHPDLVSVDWKLCFWDQQYIPFYLALNLWFRLRICHIWPRINSPANIPLSWTRRALSNKKSSFFMFHVLFKTTLSVKTFLITPRTYLKILTQHFESSLIVKCPLWKWEICNKSGRVWLLISSWLVWMMMSLCWTHSLGNVQKISLKTYRRSAHFQQITHLVTGWDSQRLNTLSPRLYK